MMDFRDLKVWRDAHSFTLEIYRCAGSFPADEKYGLIAQIRKAASSIPTNIAEGCGRDTQADLRRFMSIAAGSASEVQYQLLLARDLGFLDPQAHAQLTLRVTDLKKMLSGYMQKLATSAPKKPNHPPTKSEI
jgi:four helix bundle protein